MKSHAHTIDSTPYFFYNMQFYLPQELLLMVFSYLTSEQLCSIATVSREWNLISSDNSLWKLPCIRNNIKISKHTYLFKNLYLNVVPALHEIDRLLTDKFNAIEISSSLNILKQALKILETQKTYDIRSLFEQESEQPKPHTLLQLAARFSGHKTVNALLQLGADPNKTCDQRGMTALHYAVERTQSNPMIILLLGRMDIHSRDLDGLTPLHTAALNGRHENVSLLLQHGAQVAMTDTRKGCTPLHLAARARCEKSVQLLIDHGACITAKDNTDRLPIHYIDQTKSFLTNTTIKNNLKEMLDPYAKSCHESMTNQLYSLTL